MPTTQPSSETAPSAPSSSSSAGRRAPLTLPILISYPLTGTSSAKASRPGRLSARPWRRLVVFVASKVVVVGSSPRPGASNGLSTCPGSLISRPRIW